jgi:hypothetical protein
MVGFTTNFALHSRPHQYRRGFGAPCDRFLTFLFVAFIFELLNTQGSQLSSGDIVN